MLVVTHSLTHSLQLASINCSSLSAHVRPTSRCQDKRHISIEGQQSLDLFLVEEKLGFRDLGLGFRSTTRSLPQTLPPACHPDKVPPAMVGRPKHQTAPQILFRTLRQRCSTCGTKNPDTRSWGQLHCHRQTEGAFHSSSGHLGQRYVIRLGIVSLHQVLLAGKTGSPYTKEACDLRFWEWVTRSQHCHMTAVDTVR